MIFPSGRLLCIHFSLFPSCSCVSSTIYLHHSDPNKILGEKAKWEIHKNAAWFLSNLKTAVVRPLTSYLANYPRKTNKLDTAGEVGSQKQRSSGET